MAASQGLLTYPPSTHFHILLNLVLTKGQYFLARFHLILAPYLANHNSQAPILSNLWRHQ